MKEVQHNLKKEKRFIELLGYSIFGPDASNRWLILDENQDIVGFIQYKKMHNGDTKKGFGKVFGYHTYINSSNIIYDNVRPINDKYGNILDNIDGRYSFEIKRGNDESDHVEMDIKERPSLTMWSRKYGFIDFKVDYQGLYLNYKSVTNTYNVEETLVYNNSLNEYRDNEKYVYQIRYYKKESELVNKNLRKIVTRELSGFPYFKNKKQLVVSDKTWVDRKICNKRESIVDGTVEEMAIKHNMGIDCFDHFRFLINQIVPFKDDVVSTIISADIVEKHGLAFFFPDYDKELSGVQRSIK